MPRGSNAKREREYDELKQEFKKEHRYRGREEEVAARIVNKQRSQFGETRREKRKDHEGKSPDRDLPIKNYQHKTIDQVERAIGQLSRDDLREIQIYEKQHKNRKTLLETLRTQMKDGSSSRSTKKPKSSSKSNSSSRGSSSRTHKSSAHRTSRTTKKTTGSSKTSSRSEAGNRSRSSSGKSSSHPSKSRSSSDHGGKVTTDHNEIRRWAEERGAKPSAVIRTEHDHDPGIIRLDFPDYSGAGSLEEISWDDWFEKFEEKKLALLHQDETAGGQKSNFNKLISR